MSAAHFYDDAISNVINHLSNTIAAAAACDDDVDVDVDIEKSSQNCRKSRKNFFLLLFLIFLLFLSSTF